MAKPKLRRTLGLVQTTFFGVGIILGAGIYVLVGKAAGIAGYSVWISFILAAFVAAFTGLSYAELSSMMPKTAGEYIYTKKAFGNRIGFLVGYLVIVAEIIAAAAVALGFAGYFSSLFNLNHLILIAVGCIALFSFINFYGIKQSSLVNIVCTLIEGAGLIIIIILALTYFGKVNYFEMPFGYTGIFSAAALVFFAYIGFDSIVQLSEESKKPRKTIPRAIILSIIVSTILYVLVAASAVSVLGWEKLATSTAPLADVAAAVMGSNAFLLLVIIALFSTGNTILIILITASRIMYGMGENRSLPHVLSNIHKTRRTPWVAIALTMILAIAFALIGDIRVVAEVTNFAVFTMFIGVNSSLIWLRYKAPKAYRPFKAPINIGKFSVLAFLGIVTCLFMLAYLELSTLIGGIILLAVGWLIYEGYEYYKRKYS